MSEYTKCAAVGCDYRPIGEYCMNHTSTQRAESEKNVDELDKAINGPLKKAAAKAKAKPPSKKKAAPNKKAAPKKKKAAAKKKAAPKAKAPKKKKKAAAKKKGTPAQLKAAKAAALYPRLIWKDEIAEFKKSKEPRRSIEVGSPGSAQVTRVRLVASDYCKGVNITTIGAEIILERKGKR